MHPDLPHLRDAGHFGERHTGFVDMPNSESNNEKLIIINRFHDPVIGPRPVLRRVEAERHDGEHLQKNHRRGLFNI
jgi:hypothetical protein